MWSAVVQSCSVLCKLKYWNVPFFKSQSLISSILSVDLTCLHKKEGARLKIHWRVVKLYQLHFQMRDRLLSVKISRKSVIAGTSSNLLQLARFCRQQRVLLSTDSYICALPISTSVKLQSGNIIVAKVAVKAVWLANRPFLSPFLLLHFHCGLDSTSDEARDDLLTSVSWGTLETAYCLKRELQILLSSSDCMPGRLPYPTDWLSSFSIL